MATSSLAELSSHRRCVERIRDTWPQFLARRSERLQQQERHGVAAEKVTEGILEDLFTTVLDWPLGDLNNQIGHADLVLTQLGLKYLIVEAKRPGALAWNRRAVEAALIQARGYSDEQKVRCIGVSDGVMIYAADVSPAALHDRVFASLAGSEPPEQLWWLSVHGIYRACTDSEGAHLRLLPEETQTRSAGDESVAAPPSLLHPKYKVPANCFAYVADANNPATWKLPYRIADGSVDLKRLPKAIQCIISNYRGAKVSHVPEREIPDVLERLACAATSVGRMPGQAPKPAEIYQQLADVLNQLGIKQTGE